MACRVLQGVGGGGLATSEQAILADTFSPEKRGMAFAVYGMAVVLAPAIGPTLGGWITDNYNWRLDFLYKCPGRAVVDVSDQSRGGSPPYMDSERKRMRGNPIDYWGLGLITVGIGCLRVRAGQGPGGRLVFFPAASRS